MAEIQLGSGSSSASSHRITQSSHTLNRRYVERPSNLFIEEAARTADSDTASTPSTPSRLVNLRVHAAELQKLQAEMAAPTVEEALPQATMQQVIPRVVEFGTSTENSYPTNMNLNQVVPPEDQTEQTTCTTEMSMMPAVQQPANYIPQTTDHYNTTTEITQQPAAELSTQDLAMNIAADYAAASFGASVNNNDANYSLGASTVTTSDASIDLIAQAASEAIAAIRVATDPAEVAEQVASLRDFAANIKASSSAPEMLELSDTIEKFVNVAMKSTQVQAEAAKRDSRKASSVKVSAKPAASIKRATSSNTIRTTAPRVSARPATNRTAKPTLAKASPTKRRVNKSAPALVADEDQALRKALRSVAAMDGENPISEKPLRRKTNKSGRKRFALAFICATACVAAIVYFVGVNIPDISVKVAAMQTGIEASYPSYVPRNFSLSDISSEDGKITLVFKGPEQSSFTLSEEKSSWDSTALLRNYIEPTWQKNYTTTHEQGVTVYISGSNAAWVNGGVLYKITTNSNNSLTNKQLRNIVTSL